MVRRNHSTGKVSRVNFDDELLLESLRDKYDFNYLHKRVNELNGAVSKQYNYDRLNAIMADEI